MSNEHKDTAGNTLREISSGWEILQKGVGWREFIGMTVLDDGRVINTRQLVDEIAIEVADSSGHKKQLEDDLFRHYVGIALQNVSTDNVVHGTAEMQAEYRGKVYQGVAISCCETAQAMIDELKKRGRL